MNITISVSEKVRKAAQQNGKTLAQFVEDILEEKVEELQKPPRYMRMKGMFSSGKTDTAKRMSEILKGEDFDSKEGFNAK